MTTINWKTAGEDYQILNKIANRAVDLAASAGVSYPKQMALMDVTAVHCNGRPLDLAGLLAADDINFSHDVFGIRRHVNRDTGGLGGCFVPRFAR